ncbi:MAG: FadR/GntR family transcriptional regulator [Actinomycetota bacterium]
MALTQVRKTSASSECFEQLAAEITGGHLGPGALLPAERTLTETFGVNRQAIREALQRLAQAGLIRISQGEPTKVLDFRRTGTLDLLPRVLFLPSGEPDPETIRSVMEMRLSVGSDAARLAADRATVEHLQRLRSYPDEARAVEGEAELAAVDLAFWETVIEAADNIAYRLAFNSLRAAYEPLVEAVAPVIRDEISDVEGHLLLIDAIDRRDGSGAMNAARALLSKGATSLAMFISNDEGGRK